MNIKKYPDVDGFYWHRCDKNSSFKIVLVSQGSYWRTGNQYGSSVGEAEWIGPLMPDNVDIYISKETKK